MRFTSLFLLSFTLYICIYILYTYGRSGMYKNRTCTIRLHTERWGEQRLQSHVSWSSCSW